MLKNIDFYFITDSALTKSSITEDVKKAISAGVKIVQYREKNKSTKEMYEEAKVIRQLTEEKNVLLIINDRIDIALAVNADGIHLGQEDMPFSVTRRLLENKIIGLTVHNVEEAAEAEKTGADYVGLSPIFATTTKKDAGLACGLGMIEKISSKINIPLVAIGGITKDNIKGVIRSGADSAVAISAVLKADVEEQVKDFIKIINESKK
ncbi:thiamine phosphate synthase [Gemmatimonadota bacterium]